MSRWLTPTSPASARRAGRAGGEGGVGGAVVLPAQQEPVDVALADPDLARVGAAGWPGRGGGVCVCCHHGPLISPVVTLTSVAPCARKHTRCDDFPLRRVRARDGRGT